MSDFVYQARNEDLWKKRQDQSGSQFDSYLKDKYKTYTLRNKENCVRILPPTWENPLHYGFDVWVHYSVGPSRGSVLCPQRMGKGKCPICETQIRYELNGREDAKELKAGRRVLTWVLDRKEETIPLLWAMPWSVDKEISQVCRDRQSGKLYQIDHPTEGYDIFFDKEGKELQTKYSGIQLTRESSSVNSAHLKYIKENPLPETLLWRDYNELKFLIEGEAPPESPKEPERPVEVKQQPYVMPKVEPGLVLEPQEFCGATFKAGGKTWGCSIIGEHKGDHDYSREASSNGNGKVEEPVVAAASSASSKAASLKSRFQTGPK